MFDVSLVFVNWMFMLCVVDIHFVVVAGSAWIQVVSGISATIP
jgi:hypothetical protein